MGAVSCKVADAKGSMNNLVDGLRQDTLYFYASIRHNVDQLLVAISKRLKKVFDRRAKALRQDVHDALCDAAGCV